MGLCIAVTASSLRRGQPLGRPVFQFPAQTRGGDLVGREVRVQRAGFAAGTGHPGGTVPGWAGVAGRPSRAGVAGASGLGWADV